MRAEGLPCMGTYGPVYRHMLYNMPAGSFRIADGNSCPVAEGTGPRHAVCFLHSWLASDDSTIDKIGDIVAKVAENAGDLLDQ